MTRQTTFGSALLARVFGSLAIALMLAVSLPASGVSLDSENRIDVVLDDGTKVVLYGEAAADTATKSNNYRYLPVNLRLSERPDGTPEFQFLRYVTEERKDQGGVGGALIHLLMEWGLTNEQERQLRRILRDQYDEANLVGAVELQPQGESGKFQIISGTLTDEGLTQSLVTSGKAPLVPGGKAAVAARFDANGAALMSKTFDGTVSVSDLSFVLNFTYSTLMPRAKGAVVIDWEKLNRSVDVFQAEYERKNEKHSWFGPGTSHTDSEVRSHFAFLSQEKVIDFQFEEEITDARAAEVREAFFEYYLSTFAELTDSGPVTLPAPSEGAKGQSSDIRFRNSYTYKQAFLEGSFKKKIVNLQYRTTIKRPFQLVANLSSWRDSVSDCRICIDSVNLNDPFFQHRDIHFVLDLDAKEMFEDVVNFVVVKVRKRRSSGDIFAASVLLDANYIAENGIAASITYARGEDKDADSYEYQVQWSLRGGVLYPPDSVWQKGNWEGVTLTPPVVPRTIEVEGNLDDMQAKHITRVTAQIRYLKFDKEVVEDIHLSSASNTPLVSERVFMDRDARNYDYRLIVNHKTEGRIELPWNSEVGDDYIYAGLPSDLPTTRTANGQKQGIKSRSSGASADTSGISIADSAGAEGAYYDSSYAVVIGIDKYPASRWPNLSYARKDAEGVGAFLEGQGFRVTQLINEQATKSAIIKAMQNDLARRVNKNDRILVFFAGHGHTEELANEDWGYIVPYHEENQSSADYISMEELQTLSRKMGRAKHQLFIMDACYGGLLTTRGVAAVDVDIPNYLQDVTRRTARLIITAGGKDQQVLDEGPDDHSVFTGLFLEALEKAMADINGDGYITFSELTAYLVPRASNAYQTPALGYLPGHGQGEFVFHVPRDRQ